MSFLKFFSGKGRDRNKQYAESALRERSTDELLSLMRHESHRIEKAVYNDILESKAETYRTKLSRVRRIHKILAERGVREDEPTVEWSRQIAVAFDNLAADFIEPNSTRPSTLEPGAGEDFVSFVRSRRSARVWSDDQPNPEELLAIARTMIDGARWAPNSGNRQAWRFRIMVDDAEKLLLKGIKEQHTLSAPLLVFVGMDTRVYGALGASERGVFIDAGAAIMQMLLVAHAWGIGVCWNHFADDLIQSRESNRVAYGRFTEALGIADYIAPIAIVAIGRPEFLPPEPARTDIDDLLLG